MRLRSRRAYLCCALLLAVGGVSACGSANRGGARSHRAASAEPDIGAAAVHVGRYSLTPAEVEHWTRVEAAFVYHDSLAFVHHPTPPKGAIPDPPSYANCIAYLAAKAKRVRPSAARPARATLLRECEAEQQGTRRHVLELLLTDFWVREEMRARGVVVTQGELQQLLSKDFVSRRQFERYLAATGERESDERFMLVGQLGLDKLQQAISPLRRTGHESAQMAGQVDLAYQRFGDALKRKWIPRTDCRAGYVVVECRQYRGPADQGTEGP